MYISPPRHRKTKNTYFIRTSEALNIHILVRVQCAVYTVYSASRILVLAHTVYTVYMCANTYLYFLMYVPSTFPRMLEIGNRPHTFTSMRSSKCRYCFRWWQWWCMNATLYCISYTSLHYCISISLSVNQIAVRCFSICFDDLCHLALLSQTNTRTYISCVS